MTETTINSFVIAVTAAVADLLRTESNALNYNTTHNLIGCKSQGLTTFPKSKCSCMVQTKCDCSGYTHRCVSKNNWLDYKTQDKLIYRNTWARFKSVFFFLFHSLKIQLMRPSVQFKHNNYCLELVRFIYIYNLLQFEEQWNHSWWLW